MELQLERLIPPLPTITRGVPLTLGADPKGIYLLYTNKKSVVMRNLKDFCTNDMYVQHVKNAKAAKYSPSGYFIASSDECGKVMVWDTVNPEHILRNEFLPFSGPINDLAWTSDNRRIIVGGKGQSKCAGVHNSETGSSISSLIGISANVNSVDIRPTAPPRAIVGDSEGLVSYFEGSSYEFKHHARNHLKCVNVVRFSPNGAIFLSAGSEGKIFLYNSDDGSTVGEVGSPAHRGGIYGLSFSKSGSRFVSASADKSIKLWGVEGQQVTPLSEYKLEDKLNNMMLGCCWVGDTIAAITLNGAIHLFDAPENIATLSAPRAVLSGHVGTVTCGVYSTDTMRLITSASDGSVVLWNLDNGLATPLDNQCTHAAAISDMTLADEVLITVGLDDRCIMSNITDSNFNTSIKLPSQPHSVGVMPARKSIVVGCDKHVVLLNGTNFKLNMLDEHATPLGKNQLTVSPRTGTAMVCRENEELIAFKVCGGKLVKSSVVNPPPHPPCLAAYSPDGSMIALIDLHRTITIHTIEDNEDSKHTPTLDMACTEIWQKHSARVTAVSWSPNGKRLATGSLDTSIIVWSLTSPKNTVVFKNAHPKNHCVALSWINDSTLCSVAPDGSIRCWKVPVQ